MSKYTQHYDNDGDKSGWSEDQEGIFGDKYEQHHDSNGNKSGYSEERTDIFGDKYTQNYDKDGNKAGSSEEKTGLFGDKFIQHYDNDGNKTGYSEDRTGILGDDYVQHHDNDSSDSGHSEEKESACFITSACVRARTLPDDCEELAILRRFRDEYVRKMPQGGSLVSDYYEIAPRIVKAIDQLHDAEMVYADLYERLVKPCVGLIRSGQQQAAVETYMAIVNELRKRYNS